MRLNYRLLGDGPPLLILHGLFGSLANWQGIGQALASGYRVILADLRNHGDSPHAESMDYTEMAGDLRELQRELQLDRWHMLGHSMGGKAAMQFALETPGRVAKLIVADIAPKSYPPWHGEIIEALLGLDLGKLKSRGEMERALEPAIPELAVRRFLLANVRSEAEGAWRWRLNLLALRENYDQLSGFAPPQGSFAGPALFVRGEKSGYIPNAELPHIRAYFPAAELVTIEGAGHWINADKPAEFTRVARQFLERENGQNSPAPRAGQT